MHHLSGEVLSCRTLPDKPETAAAISFGLFTSRRRIFTGHVSGPHFRDYHLLLDDRAEQVLAMTDDIAERVGK